MKLIRTNLVQETIEIATDDFEEALDIISTCEVQSEIKIIKAGDWEELL